MFHSCFGCYSIPAVLSYAVVTMGPQDAWGVGLGSCQRSSEGENTYLALAKATNGGCAVELIGSGALPLRTSKAEGEVLADDVLKNRTRAKLISQYPAKLGNLSGYQLDFSIPEKDTELIQSYVFARRNLATYTIIISVAVPVDAECQPNISWIREHLQL